MIWDGPAEAALSWVGVIIAALGVVHLRWTDSVFAFYKRFNERRINEGRPEWQLFGGWSPWMTRFVGWGLIAIGAMAFIGGLT